MSFKMSVLFCVLYLFMVAWSIGLNIFQICKLVRLSVKHNGNNNNAIPSDNIIKYLSDWDVGYTGNVESLQNKISPQTVLSKEFFVDNKTMPEFLIILADTEKDGDNWKKDGLTTYEVKLFVGMFKVQDKLGNHDGLLAVAELNELFDDKLNLQESIKSHIKEDLVGQEPMNVLLYLALIMKHKYNNYDEMPTEYLQSHLNKAQIDKCLALYNSSESHLDSGERKALFKTLNIVSKEYEYLLDFKHAQPAALELEELLVFWSEYDKNFDKDIPYISLIRLKMRKFNLYDKNHDGLLDIQELEEYANDNVYNEKMEAFLRKYITDGSPPMGAAMFLNMFLSL